MLKAIGISFAVSLCIFATFFCLYASQQIIHAPGYEIVQCGVVYVGICYAVAAILILHYGVKRA